MRVANVLAGFSLAEADVLRKAVGKKDAALTEKVLREFRERASARGIADRQASEIAELLRTFGRYGFNKAHAAAYALLSYRTAWLKAHYPAEFIAALLSSEIGSTDRVVAYIAAARGLGLEILPPSVNESGYKFTVVDDRRIRFGLGAIRGVGQSAIESILEGRSAGPYGSLFDFCTRVDLRLNNKRVIECLIQAGALDDLGERAALLAGLEAALAEAQLRQRERETGQASLFGEASGAQRPEPTLPAAEPMPESDRLKREKEVLGFYISGHPLERYRELVELFALDASTRTVAEMRDRKVELACVVTGMEVRVSRRDGREWCRLTLEDFHGTATALAFGEVWLEHRPLLAQDAPVLVVGTVSGNSRDEDDPPIFIDSVRPLSEVRAEGRVGICIELRPGDGVAPEAFGRVRKLVEGSPGSGPLLVRWRGEGNGGAPLLASETLRVAPTAGLLAELRSLLGSERVRLVRI